MFSSSASSEFSCSALTLYHSAFQTHKCRPTLRILLIITTIIANFESNLVRGGSECIRRRVRWAGTYARGWRNALMAVCYSAPSQVMSPFKNASSCGGSGPPSNTLTWGLTHFGPRNHVRWFLGPTWFASAPKRHVDRFCTAHPCAKHTDTQTTLRATATSVAIGFIYALRAGDVADLSNSRSNRWTSRWIIRRIFTWELEQLTIINNWHLTMAPTKKYTRLAKAHFWIHHQRNRSE